MEIYVARRYVDHARPPLCANEKPTDPVENFGGIVGSMFTRLLIVRASDFQALSRIFVDEKQIKKQTSISKIRIVRNEE